MYLTMFVHLAASIQVIIFKKINLNYAVYIQLMTFFATIPGIFFQRYLLDYYGKVSIQVFILASVMIFLTLMVTVINVPIIAH